MEQNLYFNAQEALQRVRGNQKILTMMLQMFLRSEEPQKLNDSLEQGDYASAAALSHAIKGVAGNLSLTALYEAVTELNQQLKQGACSPDCLARYRAAFDETVKVVEQAAGAQ